MSAFIEFLTTQKDFYLPAKVTKKIEPSGNLFVEIPIKLPVKDTPNTVIDSFFVGKSHTVSIKDGDFIKIKIKEIPCLRTQKNTDEGLIKYDAPTANLQTKIDKKEYIEKTRELEKIIFSFNNHELKDDSLDDLVTMQDNWFKFSHSPKTLISLLAREDQFNRIVDKLQTQTQATTYALEQSQLAEKAAQEKHKAAERQKVEFEEKIALIEPREQVLTQKEADIALREKTISHDIIMLKQLGLYSPPKDYTASQSADTLNGQDFQKALSYPQSALIEKSFQLALISSLVRGRIILLEGSVGVGKTHLAENFAKQLGGSSKTIPVRPSWIDSSDLFGFFDPLSRIFRPASFTEAICEFPKDRIYPVILDEMNLGRIENYGADLLSRIEKIAESRLEDEQQEKQLLQIWSATECASLKEELTAITNLSTSSQKPEYIQRKNQLLSLLKKYNASMPLPDGFILMGTLNADESTFEISPKVIDRSYVLSFPNLSKTHFNKLSNDTTSKYIFSPQALREEFAQYSLAPDESDWEELSDIITDQEMAMIGIPYSYRLLTDLSDLRIFCEIMGYEATDYTESFIWSRILPRVSFFKSSDEKVRKNQELVLNKVIKQIPNGAEITKYLSQQMEDDNRNLVKFFGR